MIRKFPIIRPSVGYKDIWRSIIRNHVSGCRDIAAFMAVSSGNRFVYPLNSGLAAFYLILSCLKSRSERKEVVIPAYTAGSLVVAIKKAGLKPVLCDISLDELIEGTGWNVQFLVRVLSELEGRDLVTDTPGQRYARI